MGSLQGGQLSDLLRISGLTVRFGEVTALDGLDLTVRRGEFFVLLGPSGSGKTTLLRAVGGFVRPSAGTIELDGVDLAPLPPHRRPVNTVFQSGALFPHLSVAANIGFGPRQRGMRRDAVDERVRELLVLVRLEGYENRRPHQLSGGQQQRVALARGLAAEPSLLLLDEPLSALDRGLRAETAAELVRLQKRLGTTFIQVTHDQQEALTMADRIGVMRRGEMAQIGTPREIYEQPADRFVAEFMGVSNLWDCIVRDDGTTVRLPGVETVVQVDAALSPGPAVLGIRAERMRVGTIPGTNQLTGVLERTIYAGDTVTHSIRLSNGLIASVSEPAHNDPVSDGTVNRIIPIARLHGVSRVTVSRGLSQAFSWSWLILFSLVPLGIILVIALAHTADTVPPFSFAFDLGNFVIAVSDGLYRAAFWLSLRTAALTTIICLLAGYPMALAIARSPERWRNALLLALMLPFWTGFLMRINAWIGMLRDDGWINAALGLAGIPPVQLIYTDTALYIGMVYTYLPFMVLPIYARLAKLDATLLEAAADLGASPVRAFLRVTLPLSLPGIVAGSALVFVPAMGEFVVPELLGGPGAQLVGRVLWGEFFQNSDWPMAAALAWLLLVLLVLLPICMRAVAGLRPGP